MKTIRIVLFPFSSVLYNHCVHSISSRPFLHTQDMYFVFVQLLSSGSAWFAIIIIVITCLFPDVVKKVFYRHLLPTSTQKSQVTWEEGREDLYRFFWWERWYRSWAICLTRIKNFFLYEVQPLRGSQGFQLHPAGLTSSHSVQSPQFFTAVCDWAFIRFTWIEKRAEEHNRLLSEYLAMSSHLLLTGVLPYHDALWYLHLLSERRIRFIT